MTADTAVLDVDVVAGGDGKLRVVLDGVAEAPTIAKLGTAIDAIHERAVAERVGEVVVDLLGLAFATSAALKIFVSWLQRVRELDEPARYRIVFVTTKQHQWQARSMRALLAFAADVLTVREG